MRLCLVGLVHHAQHGCGALWVKRLFPGPPSSTAPMVVEKVYHAGLTLANRKAAHRIFVYDEVQWGQPGAGEEEGLM